MSEIDEYKKSAAIASIKFNARLINGVIALSIFSVFMTITKFLYPLLSYMPINSIVIMLAITAVLIFLGFYLSNLSARTAIQRLNDYSNQVSKMVNTMEHEINQRKVMEKDLLAMSLTDDLTGLNNRRGFLTLATQYLKMVNRQKTRTFLFYADADNFKHINDTFGHKEGDRVLIDIANMLIKTFRDSDIIARIGGDEFVAIPIGFHEFNPDVIKNRLVENLNQLKEINNRDYNVSISIGIANYDPEKPCSIEELLERADRLMYQDKKSKQPPSP